MKTLDSVLAELHEAEAEIARLRAALQATYDGSQCPSCGEELPYLGELLQACIESTDNTPRTARLIQALRPFGVR